MTKKVDFYLIMKDLLADVRNELSWSVFDALCFDPTLFGCMHGILTLEHLNELKKEELFGVSGIFDNCESWVTDDVRTLEESVKMATSEFINDYILYGVQTVQAEGYPLGVFYTESGVLCVVTDEKELIVSSTGADSFRWTDDDEIVQVAVDFLNDRLPFLNTMLKLATSEEETADINKEIEAYNEKVRSMN